MVPFDMVSLAWGSHMASKRTLPETQLVVPLEAFIILFFLMYLFEERGGCSCLHLMQESRKSGCIPPVLEEPASLVLETRCPYSQ